MRCGRQEPTPDASSLMHGWYMVGLESTFSHTVICDICVRVSGVSHGARHGDLARDAKLCVTGGSSSSPFCRASPSCRRASSSCAPWPVAPRCCRTSHHPTRDGCGAQERTRAAGGARWVYREERRLLGPQIVATPHEKVKKAPKNRRLRRASLTGGAPRESTPVAPGGPSTPQAEDSP